MTDRQTVDIQEIIHIIISEIGPIILLLCHQMMKVPDDGMNDEYC